MLKLVRKGLSQGPKNLAFHQNFIRKRKILSKLTNHNQIVVLHFKTLNSY